MRSLDAFAEAKLDHLDRRALRRSLADTARGAFPYVMRDGRRLLSFSCNDYLGLSHHPAVKAAAVASVEAHGVGAGGSRLVTGNHPLYAGLEARLARAKGTQAACVFGSGYLANLGVIGALAGPEDLIVIDELAHACLNAGAKLSGARVERFRHNDADDAAARLALYRGAARHALLVTETVFSMNGDRAPLAALVERAGRHDAWLLTDDAHGFGTVPHEDVPVPLQMGTLSKALGGYGGYLCASRPVVDLIETRARSLIYSTALPPACVAAASAALDVIAADSALTAAPLAKARRFTRALDLPEAESPIVPLILCTPEAALAASAALAEAGFLVTAIRPPTVPAGTARLRFAFSALHPDAEIDRLSDTLRRLMASAPEKDRVPGLLITATGTEVGKTYVTAALLRAGRRAGLSMGALKPVLTGYAAEEAAASDAGVLLAALGEPVTEAGVAALSPFRFAAPLAPNMAAAAEGRTLDFEALTATCRAALRPDRLTLIEGIGGVMVPLDSRRTVLDLVATLALPVVLVTGSALGAISHCLAAYTVLAQRGCAPCLIVLNESAASTVPLPATRDTLAAFCPGTPVTILPREADAAAEDTLLRTLIAATDPSRAPQTAA